MKTINNKNKKTNNTNETTNSNKESFIVTLKESIVPDNCPDYMTNVNNKYFIVSNDNPGSPKIFNTLPEAYDYLENINCPKYKPILIRDKKDNNTTVDEPYLRTCNKKVAINNFLMENYNFSINEIPDEVDEATFKELIPDDLKQYDNDIIKFLGPDYTIKGKSREDIKNDLVDFVNNAKPETLITYKRDNCEINEFATENNGISGSFNDFYNSINTVEDKVDEDTDLSKIGENNEKSYALLKNEFNLNEHPITDKMMDKIFGIVV